MHRTSRKTSMTDDWKKYILGIEVDPLICASYSGQNTHSKGRLHSLFAQTPAAEFVVVLPTVWTHLKWQLSAHAAGLV